MYMRFHFDEVKRQQNDIDKLVEYFLDNLKPEKINSPIHHAQINFEKGRFEKLMYHHTFKKIYKNFIVFVYDIKINYCEIEIKMI